MHPGMGGYHEFLIPVRTNDPVTPSSGSSSARCGARELEVPWRAGDSAMGPLHPPEYFAEAIGNPNAVVAQGKGYEAPDGSSGCPGSRPPRRGPDALDLLGDHRRHSGSGSAEARAVTIY